MKRNDTTTAQPSPTVRALHADAAEDYARHQDAATALASRVQHDELRTNASESAACLQRRPF